MESDIFSFAEENTPERVEEENIREKYLESVREKIASMRNSQDIDIDDADIRFSTSLPLYAVRNATIAIIGAGGLGNSQWDVLLGMGFRHLAIFDDDKVGIENIGSQGHDLNDIGLYKVEAIRQKALIYRGVEIEAVPERVSNFGEVTDKLGYVPDIVITCTDSADFRRSFFNWFVSERGMFSRNASQMPLLWLDYRMSLGDWTCYALPLRFMTWDYARLSAESLMRFMQGYRNEAIFPENDVTEEDPETGELRVVQRGAVHESCTERGIIYTPKACGAYTGAYLHWFYKEFRKHFPELDADSHTHITSEEVREAKEAITSWIQCKLPKQHKVSFSARDWEFITETRREENLRKKLLEKNGQIEALEDELEAMRAKIRELERGACAQPEPEPEPEQQDDEMISWGELRPGDKVLFIDLEGEDGEPCRIIDVSPVLATADYDGKQLCINSKFGVHIKLISRDGYEDGDA